MSIRQILEEYVLCLKCSNFNAYSDEKCTCKEEQEKVLSEIKKEVLGCLPESKDLAVFCDNTEQFSKAFGYNSAVTDTREALEGVFK